MKYTGLPWRLILFSAIVPLLGGCDLLGKILGTSANPNIPTEGLVAHWSLDEYAGLLAQDTSPFLNAGTLTTDIHWRPSAGHYGGALEFSGDHFVTIRNAPSLEARGSLSVLTWVQVTAASKRGGTVIGKGSSWRIERPAATDGVSFLCCGHPGLATSQGIEDGSWHHVAAVASGQLLLLYLDGALQASGPAPSPLDSGTLDVWIGADPAAPDLRFEGMLDDILLFSRALSAAEVKSAMNGRKPAQPDRAAPTLHLEGLKLKGRMAYSQGLKRFAVNQKEVLLQTDGAWEVELSPAALTNPVLLEAEDLEGQKTSSLLRIDKPIP